MDIHEMIDKAIAKQLEKGKRDFAIYPFGENGVLTKEILNWRYGIEEKAIVDNHLAAINPRIKP